MIGGTVTTIVGCVYVLTHPSFYEGIKAVVDSFVKGITAVVDSFVKGIVNVLNFLPEWARPLALSLFAASCFDRNFPVVVTYGIGRSVYDGSIETANILRYAAVSLRDVATTLWPFMTRENISRFFGISMMVAYSPKLAAAAMNLIRLAFAGFHQDTWKLLELTIQIFSIQILKRTTTFLQNVCVIPIWEYL